MQKLSLERKFKAGCLFFATLDCDVVKGKHHVAEPYIGEGGVLTYLAAFIIQCLSVSLAPNILK